MTFIGDANDARPDQSIPKIFRKLSLV